MLLSPMPPYLQEMELPVNMPASVAQRRSNAIARAATLTVDYFICPDQQTVIIASATTVGKLYHVTATGCTCPAGLQELPCKRAAYRVQILSLSRPHTMLVSTHVPKRGHTLGRNTFDPPAQYPQGASTILSTPATATPPPPPSLARTARHSVAAAHGE